jgi:uncharacterized protein
MPAIFNIRQVEKKNVELRGEIPIEELDWGPQDECVHANGPVIYEIEVEQLADAWLARGHVLLKLKCECVRCLKEIEEVISFPDWACHLPMAGEDVPEIKNDLIDLTPHIREDILLAIPQHPLCEAGCPGLGPSKAITGSKGSGVARDETDSSAWAALNKLKL